ncbi:MAG: hypothetical protein NC131_06495 [Roseburia sp.]|nr:hypothetical protein [Roseburia sp.]
MELNTPQTGIYPYNIYKCFYQQGNLIRKEAITIESKYQFDSLLEEVKQYNSDSCNQDEEKTLKITK